MRCVSWLHPEAGDSNIVHYPISGKARRGKKMQSPMILSPYDCSYYQAVNNCQARTVDKRNFPMLGVKNMFNWFMALGARLISIHFSVSNCLPWKPRLWQQSVWGGKCKVEGRGCKRKSQDPTFEDFQLTCPTCGGASSSRHTWHLREEEALRAPAPPHPPSLPISLEKLRLWNLSEIFIGYTSAPDYFVCFSQVL